MLTNSVNKGVSYGIVMHNYLIVSKVILQSGETCQPWMHPHTTSRKIKRKHKSGIPRTDSSYFGDVTWTGVITVDVHISCHPQKPGSDFLML